MLPSWISRAFCVLMMTHLVQSLSIHEVAHNCTLRDTCGLQHYIRDERSLTCSCDGRCEMYDDCCENYDLGSNGLLQPRMTRATCRFLQPISARHGVNIIGTCPENYDNSRIRTMCESHFKQKRQARQFEDHTDQFFPHTVSEEEGLIPFVPVSSLSTGAMYRNVYCSICSAVSDAFFWNIKMNLRTPVNDSILSRRSELLQLFNITWRRRYVTFDHPTAGKRACRVNVKDNCPNGVSDVFRSQCHGPTSRVFHRYSGEAYRNRYCALCNGVSDQNMTCIDSLPLLITSSIRRRPPLPYALLLDLNTGTASLRSNKVGYVKVTQSAGEDDVGDLWRVSINNTQCSDEVFDPVFNICSNICDMGSESGPEVCKHATPHWELMFKFDVGMGYITLVGNILSMIGLIILLFVYIWISALRNTPGQCLMCLASSLLMAQILFTAGLDKVKPRSLCVAIAMLIHYCFLAQFCWMNVMAFDVWRVFKAQTHSFRSKGKSRSRQFGFYSIYSWISPGIVVGLSFTLDMAGTSLHPAYAQTFCWFGNRHGLLALFALPVALILLANSLFFTLTARNICHATEGSDILHSGQAEQRKRLFLYIKLAIIMGLAWIFGFLAAAFDHKVLWYIFTIFNAFQGVFICLSFVFTQKVYRATKERFQVCSGRKSRQTHGNDMSAGSRHTASSKKTSLSTIRSGSGRTPSGPIRRLSNSHLVET